MMPSKPNSLIFKKQDIFGMNDAEDDKELLLRCFIDTGDYETIQDHNNRKCLILGRTGIGKTALLTKLVSDNEEKRKVIVVDPEALAMHHISNSTIIRYMNELGIDLNTFFKLLWRHAICVEVFDHHFKMTTEEEAENFLARLRARFKKTNARHLRALDYFENHRDTFWKKTDSYVSELVSKKESALDTGVKTGLSGVNAGISIKDRISEEQKEVVRQRAQSIVDETQMKEVTDLLRMLNELIDDQQKKYYIVIDKLDEGWVDDTLRYRLIKALIETVRDMNRLDNLKPLVVLRADLLGHVFEVTKDTGFQEEKYTSLYMHVRWSRNQLIAMIDERINEVLKSRYKKSAIYHNDILPEIVEGQPAIDYILNRTLMRPRDIIEYFNVIIPLAVESQKVSSDMVVEAGRIYSRDRLESVYYEWFTDYPNLKKWTKLLRGQSVSFSASVLDDEKLRSACLDYGVKYYDEQSPTGDRLHKLSVDVTDGKLDVEDFRSKLVHIFYTAGLIGIKLDNFEEPVWSYDFQRKINPEDIEDDTFIVIHPCFQSALNTVS